MSHNIHLRKEKLDKMWETYYRIAEYPGPVSFMIWDRMAVRMKRAHANDLNLAEVDDREGTESRKGKGRVRKTTFTEPEVMETDED